jgi:hypothetical protein
VPRSLLLVFALHGVASAQLVTNTGSLAAARAAHTATLLADGRVLIAGGANETELASGVEVYDPSSGTFTGAGRLLSDRYFHTATLLGDGRVLFAGGANLNGITATAEIYDPKTRTATAVGNMHVARFGHVAAALKDGRVLIIGGLNENEGEPLASAEIFNPATGAFSVTGSMAFRREAAFTATTLSDGRVLIVGGAISGPEDDIDTSAEMFDPAKGTFASAGRTSIWRFVHTATLLPNGSVLIAGGLVGSTEIFSPVTGSFAPGGAISTRGNHSATLVGSSVILAGGISASAFLDSIEIYDIATNTSRSAGSLITARHRHTATALADGRVLIVAGIGSSSQSLGTAELFALKPPAAPRHRSVKH